MPNLAPGHLCMLGRSAVPQIIYVRTAGSPENTSSIGENPNINDPLDPHPNRPRGFFCPKIIYGTFSALSTVFIDCHHPFPKTPYPAPQNFPLQISPQYYALLYIPIDGLRGGGAVAIYEILGFPVSKPGVSQTPIVVCANLSKAMIFHDFDCEKGLSCKYTHDKIARGSSN